MSEGDEQQVAMQLILTAGDVKKIAFNGIHLAKKGQIKAAQQSFKAAAKRLGEGHQQQAQYLSDHAADSAGPSLLMVHAQDHLSMAMTTIELGQEIVALYEQLQLNQLLKAKH
ncbi:PTS lactose/cellobiose transporter subunit IIA [Secundilactobacillus folii]|uniref:PTS lactose/cellobiose transporter subunit IIA n=1 Tax=Secundilactobacillus folii TaxID=2678357 RepID=A0A7X3C2L1_9LACO|nr:PTS lactose/cellobiose transporter subunit IIA [Secundilactobacillus folii]MTV81661.1 PTS lactose/cellobiose transporter subunit IIA [Secundilactobacillus folii]